MIGEIEMLRGEHILYDKDGFARYSNKTITEQKISGRYDALIHSVSTREKYESEMTMKFFGIDEAYNKR